MLFGVHSHLFGRIEVRAAERKLLIDGTPVLLGARAFDVLLALIERRDRVVGAGELFELIWPGLVVEENNLRQQVATLRRLLGPQAIATVAGRGYRFTLDPGPAAARGPAQYATARPTIAVLPLSNHSGDPGQEYFSDAITQDIITSLSRHRWLIVLARNSTFGYKNQVMDRCQIGSVLAADYVVAGSVRRDASRLRVTVELVDARSGDTLWAEHYDRDLADVFEVQDEITDTLVARLEPEIGSAERQKVIRATRTELQAWDCYHLGVAHFFRFTSAANQEAVRLFQRSREMDPQFGQAHAWWAYATLLEMVYWDTEPSAPALTTTLAAAQRALELDDHNAVFYAIKARIQLARCEYDSALDGNETAISLNPTLAGAHCGLGDTLAYQGRYDEAMNRFEKALALSPRDPQRWAFLTYGALALIFKGDFSAAVRWAGRAAESPNCQYWTAAHQAVALAYLGRPEEARAAVARLGAQEPRFSQAFARRKLFYLKRPEQLELYLNGLALAGVARGV